VEIILHGNKFSRLGLITAAGHFRERLETGQFISVLRVRRFAPSTRHDAVVV
jgi:hypothetical protein